MQWTGPIPWMIVAGGGVFFAVLLAVGVRIKRRVKGTKSPLIYMALGLINFGLLGLLVVAGAAAKVGFEQYKVAIDPRGKSNAEIIGLLESGDYNVRYNAVQRIRPPRFPAGEAVPALTPLLDDGAMRVRMASLYALKRYGPKAASAWPAMAAKLADRNARVRSAAHSVLRNSGPEAVDALWPMIGHADPKVRDAAVATIVKITPLPVDALIRLLAEFDGDPYRSALRRLVKHAGETPSDRERITAAVLDQLTHPKPEMRWAACWALHVIEPNIRGLHPAVDEVFAGCLDTCLLQLAKGPISFRQRAAWLLGRYPEHAARSVPALVAALQDPPAQRAAAEALGDLGPAAEPAIPALIEGLRDPGLAKFPRAALVKLGEPALAACRAAQAALEEDDPKRYRAALQAIVAEADGE
jgi:HEAT repeat protein